MGTVTADRDRVAKMKLYARSGIDHYWIVDPIKRALEIYALRDGAYEQLGAYGGTDLVHCEIPAGLELRLSDIWPPAHS